MKLLDIPPNGTNITVTSAVVQSWLYQLWLAVTTGVFANKNSGTLGQVALVAGSKVVTTPQITATSLVFLNYASVGGTQGILHSGSIVAGTSFTITSSSGTDTSLVNWIIVQPL